jgi:hypothetical protein
MVERLQPTGTLTARKTKDDLSASFGDAFTRAANQDAAPKPPTLIAIDRENEGEFRNQTHRADGRGVDVWVLRDRYEGGGSTGKSIGIIGERVRPGQIGYGDGVLLDTNNNGVPDMGDKVFKVPNQTGPSDHWIVEGRRNRHTGQIDESVRPGNLRTEAIAHAAEIKNDPTKKNYGLFTVADFNDLMGNKPIIIDGVPIGPKP